MCVSVCVRVCAYACLCVYGCVRVHFSFDGVYTKLHVIVLYL